jgi:hypothetical protein
MTKKKLKVIPKKTKMVIDCSKVKKHEPKFNPQETDWFMFGMGYDTWRKRTKKKDCAKAFKSYIEGCMRKCGMTAGAAFNEIFWQLHLLRKELAAKKEQK